MGSRERRRPISTQNIVSFSSDESRIDDCRWRHASSRESILRRNRCRTPAADADPLTVQWETTLTPKETGDYNLGVETDGFFRRISRRQAGERWRTIRTAWRRTRARCIWKRASRTSWWWSTSGRDNAATAPEADVGQDRSRALIRRWLTAAQNADVVVAVVGITSELEGEEMKVSEPGFKGGDRTSLDLPQPERRSAGGGGDGAQAAGGGADQRQRTGGELGQRTCQRDSRCVVSRRRGRNGGGGNALGSEQSCGTAAGDVLQRAWISCRRSKTTQ